MKNTVGDSISHSGIIDSISNGVVKVRITQSSACGACKVASYCSSSESKEKLIDVKCGDCSQFNVGQKVRVSTDASNGTKVVFIAFVIPAILLMTVIAGCVYAGLNDAWAALSGIGVLIPYYLTIYFMNDTLTKELRFSISTEE